MIRENVTDQVSCRRIEFVEGCYESKRWGVGRCWACVVLSNICQTRDFKIACLIYLPSVNLMPDLSALCC
jgi:hypothetical protein